jgi:tRNA-specific 2-thiouridylase
MTKEAQGRGRVLVAMSGGVDSSVTALLLQRAGYDCVGVTMRLFDYDGAPQASKAGCCRLSDVEDAQCVAYKLGIPHHVIDLSEEFREEVIGRFVAAYGRGCTPNPCIECNRRLKFGSLMDHARDLGCDFLATGHYAQVSRDGSGVFHLGRPHDLSKDQSYALYALSQDQLSHLLLPLGGLPKTETRALAEQAGLVNARKHDSQDICFVPDGDYAAFLEREGGLGRREGRFVLSDGTVLGRHRGIERYTIGQRKGLGIPWTEPLYVIAIDPKSLDITLGGASELGTSRFEGVDARWTAPQAPSGAFPATARVSYHGSLHEVEAIPCGNSRIRIEAKAPIAAVTPGQAVVLYDGDEVLGGATIADRDA